MASSDTPVSGPDEAGASPTDQSLLRRLRGGNEDAAAELYARYSQRLLALAKRASSADLARREDAEDIVQSVFGSFFRRAKHGRYDVPAGEDLWKLLLVIALNKIRAKGAFHRAAKRDVRMTAGSDLLDDPGGAVTDESAYASLRMVVTEALDRLPGLQRQMATMRIEGFDMSEIAAATCRSYRTVERGLKGFRQVLAELLAETE